MSETKTYVCHVCEGQKDDGDSCHAEVRIGADDPSACPYGLTMYGTEPSKWESTGRTDVQEINRKLDEVLESNKRMDSIVESALRSIGDAVIKIERRSALDEDK